MNNRDAKRTLGLMPPAAAAVAGVLDGLMSDPNFLTASPPAEILRHRHTLITSRLGPDRSHHRGSKQWRRCLDRTARP
jgi:hypothetical protein